MLRLEKTPLLPLLLLILFSVSGCITSADALLRRSTERTIDRFVMGLVDEARKAETSEKKRDYLLGSALSFAETYSMITGELAFQRRVRDVVRTAGSGSVTGDEAIIKEFEDIVSRRDPHIRPVMGRFKKRVEELVDALIRKAIEPATPVAEKDEFLKAAKRFARAYGARTGDEIFYQEMSGLVRTLPPWSISGDEKILEAFQEAMLHDNWIAREFLARKIEDRIEPFTTAVIDRATAPGTPEELKDILLKTAMNLAKTYAKMTGHHTFHRIIHRRTFTARLGLPVKGEPTNGPYVVYAPKTTPDVKNVFRPDNIVIRTGETVRWKNQDNVAHVIGSLDFLSDGHFFAPNIAPLGTFEYKFLIPGEYYYICYIHESMIGKITVEE